MSGSWYGGDLVVKAMASELRSVGFVISVWIERVHLLEM